MPHRDLSSRASQDRLNAAMVKTTALGMAVVAAGAVLALLVFGPAPDVVPQARQARIVLSALLSLVSLAAWFLARRGRTRGATWLLGVALFALLLAMPIRLELGVHSAGLPLLAALIMLAGFVIGPNVALAAVAVASCTILGLLWAEATGLLAGPTPGTAPPPAALAGAHITLFVIAGWLTVRYSRLFGDSIAKLEESRRDLQATLAAQRESEAKLHEAKNAAEAASLAKSRFLATMSHEIRTPMNGILGMAQLLLMDQLRDDERREYARTLLNSGETLLTLLNDILDLSKIEAGKVEFTLTACCPQLVQGEIAGLFAEQAQAKGLLVHTAWHGPEDQCYWTDPVRLRQMLSNLVSNAIKFTPRGWVQVDGIEIERRDGKALLEFAVTDEGIGLTAEQQTLLFKPFSQVDSSSTRQYGGTGLGLSIVRSLAEHMGGAAGVESESGRGSRFWFRIEADLLAAGEDKPPGKPAALPGAARPRAGRVLVAEDNATNRTVVEALLARLGMRVDCVDNGQAALDAVKAGPRPDLLLMDVQMPVMDGFQATRSIRQWEEDHSLPRLPIVALTAGVFADDRQQCLAVGMDGFLTKPVTLDDLASMLTAWLGAAAEDNEEVV